MYTPINDDTVICRDGYEWRPKTFPDFLDELTHLTTVIPDVCIFRGQRRSDRLLDSTFARKMKTRRNLNEIERYSHELRSNNEFKKQLANEYLSYLYNVPVLRPFLSNQSAGVPFGSQTIDLLYEWHVHVQQEPDDPNLRDYISFGTNFLDLTYNSKVGIFFANRRRRQTDEGALFIIRQTALGKVFHGGDTPSQKIIDFLMGEDTEAFSCEYSLPRFPWPSAQVKNEKVKRQQAIYIAQIDFRCDFEISWERLFQETQKQVFVKIILPANTTEEVENYLLAAGLTEEFLFPKTSFDKN
jgi:hypothetical protein